MRVLTYNARFVQRYLLGSLQVCMHTYSWFVILSYVMRALLANAGLGQRYSLGSRTFCTLCFPGLFYSVRVVQGYSRDA